MKIIITNTVALNGGDAAILIAVLDILRIAFGNAKFTVYDSQPNIASKYYPDITFRKLLYFNVTGSPSNNYLMRVLQYALRRINLFRFYFATWCWKHKFHFVAKILLSDEELKDIVEYSSANLIVSTGGTYLVESYALLQRIFDYKISLAMQQPLVFFTQSLGPFLNKQNQKTFSTIFNQSLLILLRDELSLKHLQDLDISNHHLHVTSDAVFALASETVLENARYQVLPKGSRLKIAISVRYWPHFTKIDREAGMAKYKNAIRSATEYAVEQCNAEITYISTCQGIPEYWTDDSRVAVEIVEELPEKIKQHVNVDRNFHHPKDLLQKLGSYDLVIATRMHMAILALAAGTVVFPIAYEFKTQELFNRLGMGQWVQDIELIDAKSLNDSLASFLEAIPEIRQLIFPKVAEERERALESGMIVKKALQQWEALPDNLSISV